MNALQAIAYFTREAVTSLRRSWKISLLAVLTIAVSLFVWGAFNLVGTNLGRLASTWRDQARVTVYLLPGITEGDREAVAEELGAAEWVEAVEEVSAEEAAAEFRRIFPSLGNLLDGWEEDPLPPRFEVSWGSEAVSSGELQAWLDGIEELPGVSMVDDDRDWLAQLDAAIALTRAVGLALGLVLLAAATFTIASVVRLTAYMFRDEISILRLVGATEFMIRGPFYLQGILQGVAGSVVAAVALAATWVALWPVGLGAMAEMVRDQGFLSPAGILTLLAAGAGAGLIGAVSSLRRETLREEDLGAAGPGLVGSGGTGSLDPASGSAAR